VAGAGHAAAREDQPGLNLAATLVLISLFFLPLMGGGYSSGGAFQVGFVLLPLAAGLAWWSCQRRPRLAAAILLVYAVFVLALPWWVQGGRELWYYAFELILAWIGVWVILTQVPLLARWLWPAAIGGGVLAAVYGWILWLVSGQLGYQLTGTFGLHNAFAGYLLLAWPAALVAALEHERRAWRWAYAAAAVFLAATLVLTYSRAAWLVFALQLLALALWLACAAGWSERTRQLAAWPGAPAGLLLLLLLRRCATPGPPAALPGYSQGGCVATALRSSATTLAGVGPGISPTSIRTSATSSTTPSTPLRVLQLLCELGLPGRCSRSAAGGLAGVDEAAGDRHRRLAARRPAVVAVGGSLAHAAVDSITPSAPPRPAGALLAQARIWRRARSRCRRASACRPWASGWC
jgi:hypothetical protein